MTTTAPAPELRMMNIADLAPASYNPRRIEPKARAALAKSLRRFGVAASLTWNKRTRRLVSGHQRLAILRDAGAERVPVTVVDLPEVEERELALVLNSAEASGDWDDAKLAAVLAEIRDADPKGAEALRLDEIDPQITRELTDHVGEVQRTAAEIAAEVEAQEAAGAMAERIAAAVSRHIRGLAERAPAALAGAIAVCVPTTRGSQCLVLADPSCADFVAELQRLAAAGEASPLESLFAALLPADGSTPALTARDALQGRAEASGGA